MAIHTEVGFGEGDTGTVRMEVPDQRLRRLGFSGRREICGSGKRVGRIDLNGIPGLPNLVATDVVLPSPTQLMMGVKAAKAGAVETDEVVGIVLFQKQKQVDQIVVVNGDFPGRVEPGEEGLASQGGGYARCGWQAVLEEKKDVAGDGSERGRGRTGLRSCYNHGVGGTR